MNIFSYAFSYAFNWLKSKLFESKIKYEDEKPLLKIGKCDKCNIGTLSIYKDHGLVDIEYDWYGGGPIGGGIHVSGHGHQEYQFHYNKCTNCDNWEMIEYRETPSWWDDLWGLDCPFTKGNIIEKYKNGQVSTHKYTSHTITKW